MGRDLLQYGETRPAVSRSADLPRCTAQRDHKLQQVTFFGVAVFRPSDATDNCVTAAPSGDSWID